MPRLVYIWEAKKVAIGACMQESAFLAFPSHSMLSKR